MSIKVTFTVDDDFTSQDLKTMLAYRETWCACWSIKEHVRAMYRGKRDISEMSAQDILEDIWSCITEELDGLPELE
jgi:hypothetical protein